MKICATSDLHGFLPDIPECDVLVIAGDVCPVRGGHSIGRQTNWLNDVFNKWAMSQPARHVLLVAGNHDFALQSGNRKKIYLTMPILCDEAKEIDGKIFYGSPWTPTFGKWAFMEDECKLKERFANMPNDIDILVTHGPPFNILDRTDFGDLAGSHALGDRMGERAEIMGKKSVHIFGHIHEAFGSIGSNYNVSHVNEHYEPVNPIVEIEIE